ncbi:hypothetical protein [Williamsia herbipolensis]|uniref:hypothetical protein n=1 Tax=Williamsia herbipolensis TaxID=1603258 RepID=UPI0005F7C1AB|nr:hypothetical protein [Williamsia herbipolensis]
MSNSDWALSTTDFRLLWEQQDGSEFPPDLLPVGTPGVDLERRRIDLENAPLTGGRLEAMAAFTRPYVSIGVAGIDATRDFADPIHHLHLTAAWSVGAEYAYVARQQVGAHISEGGDVTISRVPSNSLPGTVVEMLPPSSGAGRLPADLAVTFRQEPLLAESTIPVVVAARSDVATAAFESTVTPTTCGSLRVQVGSITDGRRPSSLELRFRDIPDDGRYLLIIDDPGAAMPVDSITLTKMLNRVINLLRKRHKQTAI